MTAAAAQWLSEARALNAAATPGPWERGDHYHVQGATQCSCKPAYGPLAHEGRMNINGEMMLAHVHRMPKPWWTLGITARDDQRGGLPVVIESSEYGRMDDGDAEFIIGARTALPQAVSALDAVLSLHAEADTPPVAERVCTACGEAYPCRTVNAVHEALRVAADGSGSGDE